MKTLVAYFSHSGNNKYLAQSIAKSLDGDLEELKPRFGLFGLLLLFSAMKKSPGIKRLGKEPSEYDRVILCGPLWMGQIASPLRAFLEKYRTAIKKIYFATCCGGGDETKDTQFGYAAAFRQIQELSGGTCALCEAFPITMALAQELRANSDAVMKTRLNETNFSGEFRARFDTFIQAVGKR